MMEKGFSFFRCAFVFSLLLSVAGCGQSVSAGGAQASAGKAGLSVDASMRTFLKTEFESTKACGQFIEGEFENVSVVLMPPTFPCKHYVGGCSGEYVYPNHLKVGSLFVWRHEVLHYLLDLNFGDPDAAHENELFKTCI